MTLTRRAFLTATTLIAASGTALWPTDDAEAATSPLLDERGRTLYAQNGRTLYAERR